MTHRERVLTAMRRQEPDRVPFGVAGFSPKFWEVFKEKSGGNDPGAYFDTDARGVGFGSPKQRVDFSRYHRDRPPNTDVDAWGIARERGTYFHFTHIVSPLRDAKTEKELLDYPWNDWTAPECFEHIEGNVKKLHDAGFAVGGHMACTFFEVAWQIRGYEPFMEDMVERPGWAEIILDRLLAVRLFMAEKFVRAGVDILHLGDDVSMQTGMMMSPKVWRTFFKPRMAKVMAHAKSIRPDLLIWYHSDGNPMAIVGDLADIGLDILNPCQPECMDLPKLKRDFGNRLAFWGAIGTQSTLPFGTPEDVRRVVRERIAVLGKGGGLFLEPTHTVEPEVPWENLVAFVDEVKTYGRYGKGR